MILKTGQPHQFLSDLGAAGNVGPERQPGDPPAAPKIGAFGVNAGHFPTLAAAPEKGIGVMIDGIGVIFVHVRQSALFGLGDSLGGLGIG